MPKYVIERELPGAGKLSPADLQGIAAKSCGVLHEMGPRIQWLQSYVTEDKIYCIYIAPSADAVRDGFTFGEELLNYCADMYFLVNIGRRCPTLFEPALVSEFVAANRKVYQVAQHSLEHLVEECLVRLRAAHYYGDAVGDPLAGDLVAHAGGGGQRFKDVVAQLGEGRI